LTNYPAADSVPDEASVSGVCEDRGTFQYETVLGAARTVKLYRWRPDEYLPQPDTRRILPPGPPIAERIRQQEATNSKIRSEMEAARKSDGIAGSFIAKEVIDAGVIGSLTLSIPTPGGRFRTYHASQILLLSDIKSGANVPVGSEWKGKFFECEESFPYQGQNIPKYATTPELVAESYIKANSRPGQVSEIAPEENAEVSPTQKPITDGGYVPTPLDQPAHR
jgi:hypothetical protein